MSNLRIHCYLTVSGSGAVRVTKNKPMLDSSEVCIGLDLTLPRALFLKPTLNASLVIPPEAAMPTELPVEMLADGEQAVSMATGLRVVMSVAEQDGSA